MFADSIAKKYGNEAVVKLIRENLCPACNRQVRLRYVYATVVARCECGFEFDDEWRRFNKYVEGAGS